MTWMALVHPGESGGFRIREGNQLARDPVEVEYEVGYLLRTWMHGEQDMSLLRASGQKQWRGESVLMRGLAPPADLLKRIFRHSSLQDSLRDLRTGQNSCIVPRSSSFSLWHSSSIWALSSSSCSSNIFSSRARAYLASTSDRLEATARSFLSRSSLPISSSRS